ncbi:MAG TPA: hypothetical protein VE172_04250 [Stackebrandtia sp.]|jgi:PAS domain-containing protein|uniref:hypothetical protein n=1 Tax=Stackebrandtia sp. TaxID=2023065 RepID=UPI002D4E2CFA|nr:hypothetical protein [Stackebrandtia sp.]HZE38003.1 hypothetical protein [Stackebrandtia sp.]
MPHIELSLTPHDIDATQAACRDWTAPVRGSADACLLLDAEGIMIATSPACRALLGLPDGVDGHARTLLDGVIQLVNFSASGGALPQWEAERIPPLQALHTGALARGLLRVSAGGIARTLDAVSTPLHGGAEVAGSLTFFRRC